jgi:hypothetical protein
MQLSLITTGVTLEQSPEQLPDALIAGVFQGEQCVSGRFEEKANKALTPMLKGSKTFKGKLGDIWVIPSLGQFPAQYLILVGLGPKDKFNAKARAACIMGIT